MKREQYETFKKIFSLNLDKQIIVVNDGSTDNTLDEINKNKNEIDIIINHSKNLLKELQ